MITLYKFLEMNDELIFDSFSKLYEVETGLPDYSGVFIKDGIVNKSLYNSSREKILFIAKEHNLHSDYNKETYAADYRTWWEDHVHLGFSVRISEWAHGIENGFITPYETITKSQREIALKSIAFINVKKTAGKASANSKTISGYIGRSQSLLQHQISEIAPTLIVCCFRYDNYPEQLFDIIMNKSESGTFSYGKWNGIVIINFFHPSCRKNKKWLYEELGVAYKYITFQDIT
jgi:hypothetical protein